MKPHIAVIDPAVKTAEIDCYNQLVAMSPFPCTYYLPALYGSEILKNIETPAVAERSLKGIILLGSASSVNERLSWQKPLEDWVMTAAEAKVPIFGICYGHQMLAYMFGGTVDYVTPDQFKHVGFRSVEFQPSRLLDHTLIRGELAVSHNEVVKTCPSSMRVIATTANIGIDALEHQSLPIWSVQSHPEATISFLKSHEISVDSDTPKRLQFGAKMLSSFLNYCSQS